MNTMWMVLIWFILLMVIGGFASIVPRNKKMKGGKKMTEGIFDSLEAWQAEDGQWYWHRQADNGKIISVGGEGFQRKAGAVNGAFRANPDFDAIELRGIAGEYVVYRHQAEEWDDE